ncbi:MAG: hypothetical protein O7A03_04465 [Alphaproteobacteria bacterium]|nr:hypothetical protein [Alphaproteobacteria bacterium]
MLAEVSEAEATGRTADIYAAIRASCGVGMVSLCYRHLAVDLSQLEWAWRILGPEYVSGACAQMAETLTGRTVIDHLVAALDRAALPPDLGANANAHVIAVLDAFNRANPMNYLFVSVLVRLLEAKTAQGSGDAGSQVGDPPPVEGLPQLPPILSLDDMPAQVRAQVIELADLGAGKHDRIVPSVYRHVAHWPAYIAYIHDLLMRPEMVALVDETASRFRDGAQDAVDRLIARCAPRDRQDGRPQGQARRELLVNLPSFQPRIPMMVAVGNLLRMKHGV